MENKIKMSRQRQKMTQEELARLAGVRRETIVFLEQNKYNPSLVLAHNIARVLKTSIERLFLFDD
jgi:putative transcriptional regulator